MNIDVEKAARALVESMDLAGHCPDCGKPSWGDEIPRPHHEGCKVAALRSALSRSSRPAESGEAVEKCGICGGERNDQRMVDALQPHMKPQLTAYVVPCPAVFHAHPPAAPATEAKCGEINGVWTHDGGCVPWSRKCGRPGDTPRAGASEGEGFELTTVPAWINAAAIEIMEEVISTVGSGDDEHVDLIADPEDYASLRGAIEGIIERARPTPPPAEVVLDVERAIRFAAANSPGWPLYPDALRVFINDALACGRGELAEEDGYNLENRVAVERAERAKGGGGE